MTLSEGSSNEKMILSAGITEDMQGFGADKLWQALTITVY